MAHRQWIVPYWTVPQWIAPQWIVPQWTVPYWIRPYWIVIGSALGKTVRKTGKVGASAVMPVA